MRAYDSTATPVASSQESIRRILSRYGADGVQFSEDWKQRRVMVRFLYSVGGLQHSVLFMVPIPDVDDKTPTGRARKVSQLELLKAQAHRGIWRAVFWAIKSRMEAVAFGIETFQEAFLSHFEIPGTDRTIGDVVLPALENGKLKMLTATAGRE
jgi:hypothetical protein